MMKHWRKPIYHDKFYIFIPPSSCGRYGRRRSRSIQFAIADKFYMFISPSSCGRYGRRRSSSNVAMPASQRQCGESD
uniref:Uncharacterized protein n=1 Tax=Setaria italica TaxID=4555 RepID=K3ZBE9_SETIT